MTLPKPEIILCAKCDYWVKVSDGKDIGECRLHPPQLNPEDSMWEFPAVKGTSWCGDARRSTPMPEKDSCDDEIVPRRYDEANVTRFYGGPYD